MKTLKRHRLVHFAWVNCYIYMNYISIKGFKEQPSRVTHRREKPGQGSPWWLPLGHLLPAALLCVPCPSQVGSAPTPHVLLGERPMCWSGLSSLSASECQQSEFSHHVRKTSQQKGSGVDWEI